MGAAQMKQAKQTRKKNIMPIIGFVVTAVIVCFLLGSINGTFSFFHVKDEVTNSFDLSQINFEIEEPHWEEPITPIKPGDILEKDPSIRNTGQIDFVARLRIEEVWTLKNPSMADSDTPLKIVDPNYVRYYSTPEYSFTPQILLELLLADRMKAEVEKSFALLGNLNVESSGWYRGSLAGSPWFYYNKILKPTEVSAPIFRAVTIRMAEDYIAQGSMTDAEYRNACMTYNSKLAKYNLDIIIYVETVQAEPWAWNDLWGADSANNDLPTGWDTLSWGKSP